MTLTPASGFPYYIALLGEANIEEMFNTNETFDRLSSISEEKSTFRYAAGKWSIKQIVGHMGDHERIMTYRALRFSRKDPTELPGYDQDVLVDNAHFDAVSYEALLQDYKNVRRSTISFIYMLSEEQLTLKGIASTIEISVSDLLKAILGHEVHHLAVLKERYGAFTNK
jgi:uncharacterized damage-inducible protein DinB